MIVVHMLDRTLMDREALAEWTQRSVHTIRARCVPCGNHTDGRPLYNALECAEKLLEVPERRRRSA